MIETSLSPVTEASELARLEAIYGVGNVLTTQQVRDRFEVISFLAPFCDVKERATQVRGTLEFQHSPRFYFDFVKN